MNGTTRTDLALKLAFDSFDESKGMRGPEVPKMAIVLTDGHSQVDPGPASQQLVRLKNITIVAASVVSLRDVRIIAIRRTFFPFDELGKIISNRFSD